MTTVWVSYVIVLAQVGFLMQPVPMVATNMLYYSEMNCEVAVEKDAEEFTRLGHVILRFGCVKFDPDAMAPKEAI